nr:hypothetical protein [Tanacetum cinerariifolium]
MLKRDRATVAYGMHGMCLCWYNKNVHVGEGGGRKADVATATSSLKSMAPFRAINELVEFYRAEKAFAEWTARAVGAMVGSVIFKEALVVSSVSSNLHWRVSRTFSKEAPKITAKQLPKWLFRVSAIDQRDVLWLEL